jgi:hypothetical protein
MKAVAAIAGYPISETKQISTGGSGMSVSAPKQTIQ